MIDTKREKVIGNLLTYLFPMVIVNMAKFSRDMDKTLEGVKIALHSVIDAGVVTAADVAEIMDKIKEHLNDLSRN